MTKNEYFLEETAKHIRNVQLVMTNMVHELVMRLRSHDASKYDSVEADLFAVVTPELSKSEYGSEAYKENLQKIKSAIDHHNAVNPHHPEHYLNGVAGMTLIDLLEMIADWMAASTRNPNGDVIDSIEKNQKRFGYSDEIKSILKNTAREYISDIQIMEKHERYVGE